ncbi:MAG TPA: S9 family peptidase, partial [Blastocatellia bacterium]|nr:S9 family peptidase [Blastocatellia bacterium]
MNRKYRSLGALLSVLTMVALSVPVRSSVADKRMITDMDLFKFVWVADPQISPDGSQVAFTRVWVDKKTETYDTALWIVPTAGGAPRQITAGLHDSSPRWSPDGRMIAFLRGGEKDGKPQPAQIHLLPLAGGEARPLTDIPRGAGNIQWSPNGKTILFSNSEDPAEKAKDNPEDPEGADKKPEHKSDVLVITKAVYRFNGPGYINLKSHTHLWTVAAPDVPGEVAKSNQITRGHFDENGAQWSPDGSRIYFTAHRVAEPYYEAPHTDLYSIKPDGADEQKVLSFDGGMRGYSFSNDGRRIAFEGSANHHPEFSYTEPDLFVVNNSAGAAPADLTAKYDMEIGGGIGGDQHAPRGGGEGGAIWSKDGRWVYVRVAENGRSNLKRIDVATGKAEPLTSGDQDIMNYTATPDASKIAMTVSTSTNIGDLFVLDTASGKTTQLTHVNEELFSQIKITDPEEFWYTSFDGKKIQGWIQKPPDFDPS